METLKCGFSFLALARIWRHEGVAEDNRYSLFVFMLSFHKTCDLMLTQNDFTIFKTKCTFCFIPVIELCFYLKFTFLSIQSYLFIIVSCSAFELG